jgi:hypothetical protein
MLRRYRSFLYPTVTAFRRTPALSAAHWRGSAGAAGGPKHQNPDGGAQVLWQDAGDLQHSYALEEIERQVFGRLHSLDGVLRGSQYTIPASPCDDVERVANAFSSSFPRPTAFAWNNHGRSQSEDQKEASQKPSDLSIQCDLYVKLPLGTPIEDLFKECTDEVVNLCPGSAASLKDAVASARRDVLLVEVGRPQGFSRQSCGSSSWQCSLVWRNSALTPSLPLYASMG